MCLASLVSLELFLIYIATSATMAFFTPSATIRIGMIPTASRCLSVHANTAHRYSETPAGIWTGFFIFSKFPELIDTAFLVLQCKKVWRLPERG